MEKFIILIIPLCSLLGNICVRTGEQKPTKAPNTAVRAYFVLYTQVVDFFKIFNTKILNCINKQQVKLFQ